ncbi:NHLP family bacteriocin export ABC transporter permease/ATPase subunit [Dulcicalothrix desertica PCC 7102]|uniref:NHLP family bacteriocin export ABC transporter permease/ATPase subunit n=1 Tax=Dulcicalothrix desertica PCC 7102 TaxID=232991 RepID=A0A3S1A6N9_9CYAN|nr:NHLP bacteriocin export ABC transporter permease/ATPase subunit [Dulcicalothrix desertica]RUS94718.1 NHLP family bacteriocin export ABC transporter permease/ATPase subunit [Dulcicalothrix desertica PCC 7102]TWH51328.1 ATP-binding cassette subfamily C protein [Dulcicalothrix desertica PCC 7102]
MNKKNQVLSPNFLLKANQPLLLDDHSIVWTIESGVVGLFAVAIEDGILVSDRRYLFSASAGEALFGFDLAKVNSIVTSTEETNHPKIYGILAVPLEESYLSKITQNDFEELVIDNQSLLVAKPVSNKIIVSAEKWIEKFSTFPGVVNPTTILDTSTLYTWESLSEKLVQMHKDFLRYLHQLEQQESEEILTQFQAREKLNLQVTTGALGELASILKPKAKTFLEEDTNLLMAAGAVGKALGIKILPPGKSEDLNRVKEPVEAIARASRVRMRRVILTPGWWKQDSGALLAYTASDKCPVALIPIGGSKYEIFDPETQKRTSVADFLKKKELEPVAYMFYRSLPDQNLKAVDLLKFALAGRGKDIMVLFLAGVIGSLLGMVTPQATSILIDKAIPDADRGFVMQIGIGLLAASFGTAIFQLTQSFASLRLESNSDTGTQAAVWDRLLNLPMSFFREYSIGDLQSRVSAISKMRQQLSSSTLMTLFTSLFSLLNLGLLFVYSSKLALVAVGVGIVVMIVTIICGALTRRTMRPLEDIEGEISGLMVQLIGSVSKLRIAGAENRAFAHWAKKYSKQLKLMLSTQLVEDVVAVFNIMVPVASSMIIFALSAKITADSMQPDAPADAEKLTAGSFLAFNAAYGIFINGVTNLSNTLIQMLEVVVLWERAQPILQATPEIDLQKANPGKLTGKIELEHVSFRYRADGPWNLDDVSIKAEAGEFIAFVGPSGSGKSTTIRLLLGFDTPEVGTVFYDGQDLSGLDISAIRRQLGVVLQNGRINSASIFDNISSGALITMDEAWEAARMAGFAEDIEAMPMGMHTVISEGGTNLSGGQRQRMLIARSLVLKPKILIFDEATSALDNRTQAIVSESLDRLRVTRIVIAHRLSTIRNADRIYVIEAGRVVQQGTFDQLAQQEGLFAKLMARQIA